MMAYCSQVNSIEALLAGSLSEEAYKSSNNVFKFTREFAMRVQYNKVQIMQ